MRVTTGLKCAPLTGPDHHRGQQQAAEELPRQPALQLDRVAHDVGFVARTIAPCIPGTASCV